MNIRWFNRIGAAGGLVYFILTMTGLAISPATGLTSSRQTVLDFFGRVSPAKMLAASYVQLIALLFLVVFICRLWSYLRPADNDAAWVGHSAVAAAFIMVAVHVIGVTAVAGSVYRAGQGESLQAAVHLLDFGSLLMWAGEAVLGLFFTAMAVVIVKGKMLPRWLGWGAALIGLGLFITVPFAEAGIAHIPSTLGGLWLSSASVMLLRRSNAKAQERSFNPDYQMAR